MRVVFRYADNELGNVGESVVLTRLSSLVRGIAGQVTYVALAKLLDLCLIIPFRQTSGQR